ncbi:Helitron helicase [Phytophthora megakarya]|uniref:Helitron helicase n=1 Tax=Phytophthora megakarya TaxID=4795 RepID=A0A225V9F8_9STRA|nr:Helitron helicase [Phytophthora megakarya]
MNTQQHYRRDPFSGLKDMHLRDHIGPTSTSGLNDVGDHVIQPSAFPGSERYMRQQYYDDMAVVRQFGKPDLFETVTTNPKWKEIQHELRPGPTSSDRPDIVTRIFRMKINALLDDITKMVSLEMLIQFQKRGLPHAHILIILKDHWKPRNSSDYDKFVSAEIPNPELFQAQTHIN